MAVKNDHKRKAVAIPPASVTARDGEVVVVVPDVLGKNASHWVPPSKGGRRIISKQTVAYRQSVADGVIAFRADCASASVRETTTIFDGAWRLEVIGVWPTQNHAVGFVAPRGDADAAIPQALDALQHAGILDDDARVVEVRAWNLYRRGVRATVMRLVRMGDHPVFRDLTISHLLPLVPQSPEPPTKPARQKKGKP